MKGIARRRDEEEYPPLSCHVEKQRDGMMRRDVPPHRFDKQREGTMRHTVSKACRKERNGTMRRASHLSSPCRLAGAVVFIVGIGGGHKNKPLPLVFEGG